MINCASQIDILLASLVVYRELAHLLCFDALSVGAIVILQVWSHRSARWATTQHKPSSIGCLLQQNTISCSCIKHHHYYQEHKTRQNEVASKDSQRREVPCRMRTSSDRSGGEGDHCKSFSLVAAC